MTQLELAKAIGCHDSTLRRMSPQRRKQWASLAAKGRSLVWFDILAQLMFEVEAFNATTETCGVKVDLCKNMVTVHQLDGWFQVVKSFYIYNIEELTEALQYVQGLNGGEK